MIDLGNLSANQGVNIDGVDANGLLGFGLGGADINGDGFADLLLGAPGATNNATANSGNGYVVMGSASGPATSAISNDLKSFFAFDAAFAGGVYVSAGDVNNDGVDDVLIGATGTNTNAGAGHVLFGGSVEPGSPIDLSNVGNAGQSFFGFNAGDFTGGVFVAAGDLNGDGFGDVILGSSGDDQNDTNAGAASVIFGSTPGGGITLDNLGNRGFNIFGSDANDRIGESVAVGDFNGDGTSDVAVGSGYNSDKVGVIFGGGVFDGGGIYNDVVIGSGNNTIINSTITGNTALAAGDFNGDGMDDLIIGTPAANNGGAYGGGIYAVSGALTISNSTISGNQAVLIGTGANERFGRTLASRGDVNGDGLDDIIVGSNNNQAVVVFGNRDFFVDSFFDVFTDIDNIPSANGMVIVGENANDRTGYSVGAPGDVNGDGLNDILIGSPDANGNMGRATLIFGQFNASSTDGNDSLTSGMLPDSFGGGDGNDFLFGGGGNDTLLGENGNDLLAGGSDNDSITGGNGNDTGFGQGGDDLLFGGIGDDILRGNPGDDMINGEGDDDVLRGQPGIDNILGEDGNDNLFGGADDDLLFGGAGNDTAGGNSGLDSIEGGDGNDLLRGQGGGDSLFGGIGDDILRGQQGNDFLFGGAGNDLLSGGPANDMLTGGDGSDTLESAQFQGSDTGLDFDPLEDFLSIVGLGFDDLLISDTDDGARVTIASEGDSPTMAVLLNNVAAADITSDVIIGG
ncbi:MAG: hypothetical protein RIM84_09875 [Alphaproteobacteria bacterium]